MYASSWNIRIFRIVLGDTRLAVEGYQASRWILLDYGSVVIHVFDDETRAYYAIDELWAEAGKVDLTDALPAPKQVE